MDTQSAVPIPAGDLPQIKGMARQWDRAYGNLLENQITLLHNTHHDDASILEAFSGLGDDPCGALRQLQKAVAGIIIGSKADMQALGHGSEVLNVMLEISGDDMEIRRRNATHDRAKRAFMRHWPTLSEGEFNSEDKAQVSTILKKRQGRYSEAVYDSVALSNATEELTTLIGALEASAKGEPLPPLKVHSRE